MKIFIDDFKNFNLKNINSNFIFNKNEYLKLNICFSILKQFSMINIGDIEKLPKEILSDYSSIRRLYFVIKKNDFERIFKHSYTVFLTCKKLFKLFNLSFNSNERELILFGSMFHDFGRLFTDKNVNSSLIKHGLYSYNLINSDFFQLIFKEILDDYNINFSPLNNSFYEILSDVCLNHLGFGISKDDVIYNSLNLPKKDFIPNSNVAFFVSFCDNFVFFDEIKSLSDVIIKFKKISGIDDIKKGLERFSSFLKNHSDYRLGFDIYKNEFKVKIYE